MRILFLNYEYPPLGGGAANATKYLLEEYRTSPSMTVDLVTTAADNQARVEALGDGVKVHYVAIGKDQNALTYQSPRDLLTYAFKGYRTAAALMRAEKYDFIHAFFGVPCGTMARFLGRRFGVPYIVSLRGADVPGFSDRFDRIYPILAPEIRRVWHGAAAVVANSDNLRRLALRTDPDQEISIIYNGVDTGVFSPGTPRGDDAFVILVSARLMRRKGIKFAIDAFAQLRDRYPDRRIKMLIAGGDGDAAAELRRQTAELHLEQQILFMGHLAQADLLTAYRSADVFLLPSLNEGMSNNMLEAIACGLPVVVTRTGGVEIINDGVNGFLVERQDAASITTALERLMNEPALRTAMREANIALAQKMSWQSVAAQYERLYYTLYSQTHHGR